MQLLHLPFPVDAGSLNRLRRDTCLFF